MDIFADRNDFDEDGLRRHGNKVPTPSAEALDTDPWVCLRLCQPLPVRATLYALALTCERLADLLAVRRYCHHLELVHPPTPTSMFADAFCRWVLRRGSAEAICAGALPTACAKGHIVVGGWLILVG